MISFQHCDTGVPITINQDPVTGGWEAVVDDGAAEMGFAPDDIADAEQECREMAARLNDLHNTMYWDECKAAQAIRSEFHHEADVI